ncbi:MAG: ATPase domain-containing protein [Euryarchaeota archaeon]|nr:ATPase domain-containing protein [Euryarchaeota archaeon]
MYKIGIPLLDNALKGGLPDRAVIILSGPPGSGFSIFAQQFLFNGLKNSENGLYFTSEESPSEVKEEMKFFGWDIDPYLKDEKLKFIDAYTPRYQNLFEGEEETSDDLLSWDVGAANMLGVHFSDYIKSLEGKKCRGIVDNFSYLLRTNELDEMVDLFETIQLTIKKYGGVYFFLVVEGMHEEKIMSTICHMADGVIQFSVNERGSNIERYMKMLKLKRTIYSSRLIPYRIVGKGIELETTERIL